MKKDTVGVIGIGEVGKAISQNLSKMFNVYNKDILFDEIGDKRIEYLHICIPFSLGFEETVIKEIMRIRPKVTVIHSTIQFGTTRRIFKKTKLPIVHSPIRGIHPNLEKDIKKFVKYIGPIDKLSAKLAKIHLEAAGLKTELMNSSEETELAKLLDTTYYGWNILFCKFVSKLCNDNKLDFENVYTSFNNSYNAGYKKTKPNVIRPVLIDMPGPIGGHCIVDNVKILSQKFDEPHIKFFLKENAKFKKDQS